MREAGVLLHVSSLPGRYGIGSMGKEAYAFVDFMARSGLKLWQVLPLCPTSYGDSPYQSPSAFAGNPYFIDIDTLISDGLLLPGEVKTYKAGRADYAALYNERYKTLAKAFERFKTTADSEYIEFKRRNAYWLDDYALFTAIKNAHGGEPWYRWEHDLKFRTADMGEYADSAEFCKFQQFEFFKQWYALKAYAGEKGIRIIGDMPIYVAYDSVEVWSVPRMFLLEENLSRTVVAGVPPDYFSADGQLWGNPIYDWDYMKKTDYDWWIKRVAHALEMYDTVRIDHFRAFADYYTVPAEYGDAKIGEWRKGPDMDFFDVLTAKLGRLPIIAEDLGELHDCVRELVKKTGFPGMKIMQFAFDGNPANDFFYTNYVNNCVAYPGTHDNDTTRGWFESLDENGKYTVRRMLDYGGEFVTAEIIEKLYSSEADTVIIAMQDFLDLDTSARMNTPSTLGGNWTWRLKNRYAEKSLEKRIRSLARKYGR